MEVIGEEVRNKFLSDANCVCSYIIICIYNIYTETRYSLFNC
jgi:hypothetical protein